MTINIRDNDQTAPTREHEPETPAGHDDDLMPPPVAEIDTDDDMDVEVASDDGEMHAEIDADDGGMDAEVASDDDVESRAQALELEARSGDASDTDARPEDESSLDVESGGYGRSEPVAESGDEPHLELNTGAGRPELGAGMYDAPAPGDDPGTDGASETGVASGGTEAFDVVDEVDLREAPVGVATEAGAVVDDVGVYGERWNTIQTSFVDEPRQAVESADRLVTEAMEQLAKTLVSQRDSLQAQWRQGDDVDDVDTEQLRVAFQGYRAFLFGLLPT